MSAALPWIQALGWTLVHFLWQGLLVGGVFAALRSAIPKQSCNARYANGLVALALMAILPVATLLVVHARQGAEAEATGVVAVAPVALAAMQIDGAQAGVATTIDAALPWIVCAWLAGVILVMGRSWYQWRRLVQVARRWSVRDAGLEQALGALARRFGFFRRIRVLVSDRIDTPTLIGWLRPVILLPAAVVLGFPRQQIELILAHELGHLRRYDHLVNLAQALLETLLFYHPVVHWIAREVRNEREVCCDTLVLRLTLGEPRLYAQTLAALEELRQPPPRLALAASGGVLVERVRRILGMPTAATASPRRGIWLPVAAALTVTLAMLLGVDRSTSVAIEQDALSLDAMRADTRPPLRLDIAPVPRVSRPRYARVDVADLPSPAALPMPPARSSEVARARDASIEAARAVALVPAVARPEALDIDGAPPLAVADIAAARPGSLPVVAAKAAAAPIATRMVSPEYPYSAAAGRAERVELRFAIRANGTVGDIAVLSAPSDAAFTRAAEQALKQWRFDPASASAGGNAHYRQAFVFSPEVAPTATSGPGCVRRTGTLLCRRSDDGAAEEAVGVGEGAAQASMQTIQAATVNARLSAP